ncbi:hypothetical protein A1OE_543 [Candidatus Endolissoclinum faulkneri L2]|uniref:Uncharacterized protein n=1 Tax=Candidatus Endolissoclinum faulkneri L2 TaxID=1193729 RepID=K7ZCM8_9PROT|nr:hypothetical protein A1OE_543 [Candidatus Endolissoclinum faulkneri L2]
MLGIAFIFKKIAYVILLYNGCISHPIFYQHNISQQLYY